MENFSTPKPLASELLKEQELHEWQKSSLSLLKWLKRYTDKEAFFLKTWAYNRLKDVFGSSLNREKLSELEENIVSALRKSPLGQLTFGQAESLFRTITAAGWQESGLSFEQWGVQQKRVLEAIWIRMNIEKVFYETFEIKQLWVLVDTIANLILDTPLSKLVPPKPARAIEKPKEKERVKRPYKKKHRVIPLDSIKQEFIEVPIDGTVALMTILPRQLTMDEADQHRATFCSNMGQCAKVFTKNADKISKDLKIKSPSFSCRACPVFANPKLKKKYNATNRISAVA